MIGALVLELTSAPPTRVAAATNQQDATEVQRDERWSSLPQIS